MITHNSTYIFHCFTKGATDFEAQLPLVVMTCKCKYMGVYIVCGPISKFSPLTYSQFHQPCQLQSLFKGHFYETLLPKEYFVPFRSAAPVCFYIVLVCTFIFLIDLSL